MTLAVILVLSPDWWGLGNTTLFLELWEWEGKESRSRLLLRMDNGFVFLCWEKSIPLPPLGKGFRERASSGNFVDGHCTEMATRRMGACLTVTAPSLDRASFSRNPRMQHYKEKGGFPLPQRKDSKYVFTIFSLEKWRDRLLEHLDWPQESQNLHLSGAFCGFLS